MKYLIVYYSYTGNNQKLALTLQEKLECDILEIKEKNKRSFFSIFIDIIFSRKAKLMEYSIDLNKYDYFIFISPIWVTSIPTPLKTFLRKEKEFIKNYSFVSLCGEVKGQKEEITEKLTKIAGIKPDNVFELYLNNILPNNKQDDRTALIKYKVSSEDLLKLENEINLFISSISKN